MHVTPYEKKDLMLLVPLYEHPADRPEYWERLIRSAGRLHSVVLNPASGPGEAPDERFAAVAERLRGAGVPVLGYADTDYGRRPHAAVVQDLLRHRDWYAADGTFLDQAAAGPEFLPHYRRLVVAARAAGARTVVLNHGVHPHPGYAELADLLVTFEGPWDAYRDAAAVPPWTADHPAHRFCHLVYAVPPGAPAAELAERLAAQRGAGVHCAVPGTGAHPWGTLPYALEAAG
ncbi:MULTISPECIES: spherulation-specific family 4 protein [unclassified Streptomyces]|uniref:spherulation-specific family 4 protein n=1 Tax=unclassified Streptomyces TaxID=2593676 RepID=UPI00202FDB0D|nr:MULTISPECIES: spherulation-specific family 4 protein [unclassified Streptomyces]MCM1968983.1 spherulation-specific family 4 protein [Streptomyces sp. G1]MCX5125345.1 spherulation-specific family 4 protein [Streptomyces sp. NBC_00347]MCX5298837.1 spherulation-specific family 4 protein [Streptomyces sp. NBC_00193]